MTTRSSRASAASRGICTQLTHSPTNSPTNQLTAPMPYAELHAHTAFSLLDSAALPEPLVARAKELGLAALAITDHDELGGIVRFATAAREAELPAIIGAEITVAIDESTGPL